MTSSRQTRRAMFRPVVAGWEKWEQVETAPWTKAGEALELAELKPEAGNLVAVLFDASATQIERLRLTITAGAPQPLSDAAKAAKAAADAQTVQKLPPMPAR